MAPPSLLIVCDFNGHGGTQTQVLELLAALDRSRLTPMLATLNLDPALGRRLGDLDVTVENLELEGAVRPHTFRALSRLAGRIRRDGIRLVHGFLFQGNLAAAIAARSAGVPYLTSVRNLELWKRPHEILASRWAHRGARCVTFNSRHVRDLVSGREGIPRVRTHVIANGLGAERPATASRASGDDLWPEGSDPKLVCVASLSAKKDHLHLLDAFARVQRRLPRAGLALVGEGPERGRILHRARALGIAARVNLAGRREEARSVIAAADLLVLSSIEEGMPNVVLEAMAAGVPQVVTAVGGTPETVEEGITGYLVPPRDPALMAERILRLLTSPDRLAGFGERSRESFGRRFTAARMARDHEDLYGEILGRAA